MKITFLGTGTSCGIPMLTCDCPVCTSTDPKNNRTRTSVLLTIGDKNILIDASIDFREQGLRHKIDHIDAVLCTHIHADHVFGLDDLRIYSERTKQAIPFYMFESFIEEYKDIFHHVFEPPKQLGGGIPKIEMHSITPYTPFELFGLTILPLEIMHGILPILGFRIGSFAYLTDCSMIPERTFEHLKGLDVVVLDALRYRKHSTHFNLEEAVAAAKRIQARQTYFTHIGHDLEHEATNMELPKTIELAYDGLVINV